MILNTYLVYIYQYIYHLNDQQVYEVTESDPLGTVNSLVEKTLDPLVHKGYLSLANRKYLVVSKPRLGKFYLLPKIHKRLQNVPGRPVISNCGTATERISEFLDFHIQPLVCNVPSVIKDTSDYLQKLEGLQGTHSIYCYCVYYRCDRLVPS